MLSSVWNTLMPGGKNRQSQQAQHSPSDVKEAGVATSEPVQLSQNAGEDVCLTSALPQEQMCCCTGDGCSCATGSCTCTADNCSCTRVSNRCGCSSCCCDCSLRESNTSSLERVASALEAALAECEQQRQQEHPAVEVLGSGSALAEVNERQGLGNEDVHADLSAGRPSPPGLCTPPEQQETREEGGKLQREEKHIWRMGCDVNIMAEGAIAGPRSDPEHPEGWEHIRGDEARHTAGERIPLSMGPSVGEAPTGGTVPAGASGERRDIAVDSADWSSPPTEFEYVADSPLCDARRLLRLSQRQQLRGWGWACAGLAPIMESERSNNASTSAANVATSAAAAAAAAGGRAARRGSAVVQLISSAVLSGVRPRREGIQRRGSLDGTVWAPSSTDLAGPSSGAPLMVSGWCGRWQLTSVESPGGSLSSYYSGDRRHNSSLSGAPSSCRDGESPASRSRKRPAELQPQQDGNAAPDCADPSSSVVVSQPGPDSDRQQEAVASHEESAGAVSNAAGAAAEDEASCSSTEFSDPPESGYSDDTTARRLQDLLLHRAQRHLERQSRRRLQRSDWTLNILVAGLPGIDVTSFCEQMFAEWQQVRRQQVSCGEEFVFRFRSAAPFVEVSVIAATTFTSALPYCELRLLEKWGGDTAAQQERSERRVHVCLFLIPHSAVPLPTGVLALLKRLRAVACLLPLLAVQQPISHDQLSRARGTLRLQLAASDLATLEEMLLPVRPSAGAKECSGCSHCQEQQTQPQEQQLEREQPENLGSLFTVCEGNSSQKCGASSKPGSPHPETLQSGGESCGSSNSNSSSNSYNSSSRPSSQRKPTEDEGHQSLAAGTTEGERQGPQGETSSSTSCGGFILCRSAVQLPLVLQLLPGSSDDEAGTFCACWAGNDSSSSVATPVSLRLMLVDASAMLLRERAEYGCFLPFLFQHQMQPNRTRKLRGLQLWEEEEEHQQQQQQHVQALVEMRQGQIDDSTQTTTKAQLQKQLNELRQQLQKMQQQLLQLQQQKFLQKLLREEAQVPQSYPAPRGSLLLPGSSAESGDREELLSHIAQMGLVFALMMGVGALLFTTIKRSNH